MAVFDRSGRAGSVPHWSVVLSGGRGERLRHFVRETFGLETPKQYVAFMGRRSMFQHTVDRAAMFASEERILAVADARHGELVGHQLRGRLAGRVLLQPENRETAAGVMLALAHILRRDPEAVVAFLPSDHFILEEDRFMRQVAEAAAAAACTDGGVVLLGLRPQAPESEYGWIEPGPALACPRPCGLRTVRRFIEKPPPEEAALSFRRGHLWNSFVTVARANALYRLVGRALPGFARAFDRIRAAVGTSSYPHVLQSEYAVMPTAGLSKAVFEACPDGVSVMPVEGVTWSDWGSARRILETHAALGVRPAWAGSPCV